MDADTRALQTHWWGLTLRGIAAIAFGIAAVFWPGLTLVTLIYLFSAWVLVDGVIRIVVGLTGVGRRRMWLLTLIVGLLELGVGVYLLRHPGVSFATLILLIGFMLIIGGVMEVVAVLTESDTATGKTLGVIAGAAAVLAGIVLLFQPVSGGVAFVWILGLYALIAGPMTIALSLDVRNTLDEEQPARSRR